MGEDYEVPAVESSVRYKDTSPASTATTYNTYTEVGAGALETRYSDSNLGLMDLVQMFIVYAFIIVGALSAIFIFVGGGSFILSGGNDEKIKQAVNTIRYSIIGLIITILSFTVVQIIGKIFFGLDLLSYISWEQIMNEIKRVLSTGEGSMNDFRQRY